MTPSASDRRAMLPESYRIAGALVLASSFVLSVACSSSSASSDVCGDGRVDEIEDCDDGNTSHRDGCSPTCFVEAGWVCSGEPSTCLRDDDPGTMRPDVGGDAAPDVPVGDTGDGDDDTSTVPDTIGEDTGTDGDTTGTDTGESDLGGPDTGDTGTDAGDAGTDAGDTGTDTGDVAPDTSDRCAAVDCSHLDGACATGVCNPVDGTCQTRTTPNGGGCDDGDLCTEGDRCTDGVCAGLPKACGAGTCITGTCDPSTGACSTTPAPDGTGCTGSGGECSSFECRSGECVAAGVAADCTSCAGGSGLCMGGTCGVRADGRELWDFEDLAIPPGTVAAGALPWTLSIGQGRSGSVGARSGAIGDGASTVARIPFTLISAGEVSFWYRVDSERNYDHLVVQIDGTEVGRWSGSVAWTEFRRALPAGAHTITFTYQKDSSLLAGADAAWFDDLRFTGAAPCPGDACAWGVLAGGSCGICPVLAEGASCDDDPEDCSSATCRSNVCVRAEIPPCGRCGADGSSRCMGGECGGVLPPFGYWDFESIALPSGFTTGGSTFLSSPAWTTTTASAGTGSRSARSGAIAFNETSWLRLRRTLARPGRVGFGVRTSTESFDRLTFRVNGTSRGTWSGETAWRWVEFSLAAGTYDFEWEYAKDLTVSSGEDTVYIDDVLVAEDDPCVDSECTDNVWDGATCVACNSCE